MRALIRVHTSALAPKKLKTSSWKIETPDYAHFGVVLKNNEHASFVVAYLLDGIFNFCTKFEVLSFTQSKFRV